MFKKRFHTWLKLTFDPERIGKNKPICIGFFGPVNLQVLRLKLKAILFNCFVFIDLQLTLNYYSTQATKKMEQEGIH